MDFDNKRLFILSYPKAKNINSRVSKIVGRLRSNTVRTIRLRLNRKNFCGEKKNKFLVKSNHLRTYFPLSLSGD